MSQNSKKPLDLVLATPREFFQERIEEACKRLRFQALPQSRHYLGQLLEHFMVSTNLFPVDEETGKSQRSTLAELYLRAQNTTPSIRQDLLKQLGDSSLYISGFFGDSLSRKIVDIDYYIDMGGSAYGALSETVPDEDAAKVFGEYSYRFAEFVDVLTYISQESLIQTNEDLLKLYDRYMATGSRLAEEQLADKGLITADLQKVKAHKM